MKRLYSPLAAIVLAFALSACTGCATQMRAANPYAECKSVGQCYLATTGTFNAAQAVAKDIVHNPDTPLSVADQVGKAESAAAAVMPELSKAYTLYKTVKADLNTCAVDDTACKSNVEAKILAATANVNKWLALAIPLKNDLLQLVGGE